VLFLSTVFTGADDERVVRQRKKPSSKKSEAKPIRLFFGDEAVKMINIPTVAAAYNDEMNHVDRGDQLRSYYKYDYALCRGPWQALAWTFLLDMALVNSYVVQLHGQPKWKRYTNHRKWRECIYNELFNAYGYNSQARQLYRAGDEHDLVMQFLVHVRTYVLYFSRCTYVQLYSTYKYVPYKFPPSFLGNTGNLVGFSRSSSSAILASNL
jgi:hypothetical protein